MIGWLQFYDYKNIKHEYLEIYGYPNYPGFWKKGDFKTGGDLTIVQLYQHTGSGVAHLENIKLGDKDFYVIRMN